VYLSILVHVYICVHVSSCVWLRIAAIQIQFCNLNPITEDPYSIRIHARRVPADSKTDTRDDSEIHIGSCSADQMTIRTRNRVISCEGLLLYYFLIYRCQ